MDINYYKKYEPIFGEWHIVRLIGEGSYGSVFEIERNDFGSVYKAALKVVTIPKSEAELYNVCMESGSDESASLYFRSFVEEMVREFAIMSKLKGHSNIVSYEDHKVYQHDDKIGWDILIRMELLTPLNKWLQNQKVTCRDIIMLGIDMCTALELCQKYNIIHRDIKPENIFVSESGDYKLGDFGIARTAEKSTGASTRVGTANYMAPEILRGERYDSRVDIYSLGIVMYRLLNNNRLPFMPPYPKAIAFADREQANAKRLGGTAMPAPANAEGRLAEIVLKACAFSPKDRYDSPAVMKDALKAILYTEAERHDIYPDGDTLRTHAGQAALKDAVTPKAAENAPAQNAAKTAQTAPVDKTEHLFPGQVPHTAASQQPASEVGKTERITEKTELVTKSSASPQESERVLEKTELVAESAANQPKPNQLVQKSEQPEQETVANTAVKSNALAQKSAAAEEVSAFDEDAVRATLHNTANSAPRPEQNAKPNQAPQATSQPEQRTSASQGSTAPKAEQKGTTPHTEETKQAAAQQESNHASKAGTVELEKASINTEDTGSHKTKAAGEKSTENQQKPPEKRKAKNVNKKFFAITGAIVVAIVIGIGAMYAANNNGLSNAAPDADSSDSTASSMVEMVAINEESFPDEVFRTYVSENFDTDKDGYLSDTEINCVTYIDVCNKNIFSLKGIEYFVKLTNLICSFNKLTKLDVSNNIMLQSIDCSSNYHLANLDVSNNIRLQDLNCSSNWLVSLDVSKNTALTYLRCEGNKLENLDVSKNTSLTHLHCSRNNLTSLDVSNNTALTELLCSGNQLTSLDISNNQLLTDENLSCDYNVTVIGLAEDSQSEETFAQSTETAESIAASASSQAAASAASSQSATSKTESAASTSQSASSSQSTASQTQTATTSTQGVPIDAQHFPDANFRSYVSENFDTDNDGILSSAEAATHNGYIKYKNGTSSGEGTVIDVSSKSISNLTGIEYFTDLISLECENNSIKSLNVSKNTKLLTLDCGNNQLTSLDVSKNVKLQQLTCGDNNISNIDVSHNTALQSFSIYNNQLTNLNVTNNTILSGLNCQENKLTSLDVSKNTKLTKLYCYDNQLTSLDVSQNTLLDTLWCWGNQFTNLDLSNNTLLGFGDYSCDLNVTVTR